MEFNEIVESIYSLPIQTKIELKNLLEHNLAEARRQEMEENFKESIRLKEEENLCFSSDITQLKNKLNGNSL